MEKKLALQILRPMTAEELQSSSGWLGNVRDVMTFDGTAKRVSLIDSQLGTKCHIGSYRLQSEISPVIKGR